MKHHYAKDKLDSFSDHDRRPSLSAAHKGICACGVETSRMGYSSADPWQCHACAEKWLREQFDRAMKTK